MVSYIVQLDFSADFDRVSHSGLLFKLKSFGVGGCVLSICREFLSDCRFGEFPLQIVPLRVLVDGAACEWIPIIAGVLQGSVLEPLLFIIYTSEMCELVENRLFAYADDSTLLAVVRKPADRPAVAASLNRDLARIQEWCKHWCTVLNHNKSRASVFSRSRAMNHTHVYLVLSGVSIRASTNLDILGVKFDGKLNFEDHVRGVFPVSLRE